MILVRFLATIVLTLAVATTRSSKAVMTDNDDTVNGSFNLGGDVTTDTVGRPIISTPISDPADMVTIVPTNTPTTSISVSPIFPSLRPRLSLYERLSSGGSFDVLGIRELLQLLKDNGPLALLLVSVMYVLLRGKVNLTFKYPRDRREH